MGESKKHARKETQRVYVSICIKSYMLTLYGTNFQECLGYN